jgi:hypothetical protein
MTAGAAVATGTVVRLPLPGLLGHRHAGLGWIRSRPAIRLRLGGVLELADVVESARDSGKWKADRIRSVSDASITTGTKAMASATANFTAGVDDGKGVAFSGAGSGWQHSLLGIISSIQSTTAATCSGTASARPLRREARCRLALPPTTGFIPTGTGIATWLRLAVKPVLDAAVAAYRG